MMARAAGLGELENRLGHRFADRSLLERALTHASAGGGDSYERLEFLGDRVLALVVAQALLDRFPDEDEGRIGRRFAALVRAEALARVGDALGLAGHVRAAGGVVNENVIDDVVEALIAALFLDAGLDAAAAFVRRMWDPLIEALSRPPRDPKTALQEWCQGRDRGLPVYREVDREGPDHAPTFTVEVRIEGLDPVRAAGTSKRAAESGAAAAILDMLGVGRDG